MLGANQVVLGSISKVGKMYTVSARLVNAETAEIVESADYDTKQNIEYLVTKGIKSIAYQLLAMEQPKERISLSKLIKHHKGKILTLATTLWLAWGWLPPA